jgi:hypothetical protein
MILIQIALEALLDEMTTVLQVHARSVKVMFNTGTGKHKDNKKAAIAKTKSILGPVAWGKIERGFKKKDDVCDAILQAMYVGANARALVNKKVAACGPKERKKRKRKN